MFEELVVWRRIDQDYAIRYTGFRNLTTNQVWIAFANHLGLDHERDISADEVNAPQMTMESLLTEVPDADFWKPTIAEAVAVFIAAHANA